MTKYRTVINARIYIELDAESEEDASDFLADQASLNYLANEAVAFLDSVEVDHVKSIIREQQSCDWCGSRRWSDVNGCAECGNLNDRWRE